MGVYERECVCARACEDSTAASQLIRAQRIKTLKKARTACRPCIGVPIPHPQPPPPTLSSKAYFPGVLTIELLIGPLQASPSG